MTGRTPELRCRRCTDHTGWVAYVDESIRGSTTVLVAVVVCRCRLAAVRVAITRHRRPGQRRVHMSKSGTQDRTAILSTVAALDIRVVHATATGKEIVARSACWEELVPRVIGVGVREIVIERQDGAEHRDRADIRRALAATGVLDLLRYRHLDAAADPALWIADAAAWALSRGGHWASGVRRLTTKPPP